MPFLTRFLEKEKKTLSKKFIISKNWREAQVF